MGTGTVEIRYTKWGGHGHWRFTLEPLGSDRFGWWLGGRTGILLQRGRENPVVQPHDFVMLVPVDQCWTAFWNAEGRTSPFELYVDVTTLPEVTPDAVSAVDLDLDVVRHRDGRVEVLDEDEFATHQVRLRYPRDVIDRARATADSLVEAISERVPPFDETGPAWLARLSTVA